MYSKLSLAFMVAWSISAAAAKNPACLLTYSKERARVVELAKFRARVDQLIEAREASAKERLKEFQDQYAKLASSGAFLGGFDSLVLKQRAAGSATSTEITHERRELKSEEIEARSGAKWLPFIHIEIGKDDRIGSISADGKRITYWGDSENVIEHDLDLEDVEIVMSTDQFASVADFKISDDGRIALITGETKDPLESGIKVAILFDAEKGIEKFRYRMQNRVELSRDGRWLAYEKLSDSRINVHLIRTRDGAEVQIIPAKHFLSDISFSPNSEQVSIAINNTERRNLVSTYTIETKELVDTTVPYATKAALAPLNFDHVAIAGQHFNLVQRKGETTLEASAKSEPLHSNLVQYTKDGKYLLSVRHQFAEVYRTSDHSLVGDKIDLGEKRPDITQVMLSDDGSTLVAHVIADGHHYFQTYRLKAE